MSESESEYAGVKYGDVFQHVSGKLADKAIKPQDAAMMQAAEAFVFGQTQKGGPAAAMQSAAAVNERIGVVGHKDVTDSVAVQGVTVMETDCSGARVVTESVASQVVGLYYQPLIPLYNKIAGNKAAILHAAEARGRRRNCGVIKRRHGRTTRRKS